MPTIDKISQFNRAVEYAKSRGGKCLLTEYTKAKDKMLWKCDNPTHPEWQATFDVIVLKGSWYVHCARERIGSIICSASSL